MADLASYSATDLLKGFEPREFSPVEALDSALGRICFDRCGGRAYRGASSRRSTRSSPDCGS